MKMISSLRGGLLLTSACAVLAACSGGGDVESAGAVAPITINPGGGSGGGTPTADGAVDFTTVACPAEAPEATITSNGVAFTACVIPAGTLTSDVTLVAGNAYAIDGTVFVGENVIDTPSATPVTLTIQPGVVLFGANGEDALVVSPGSDINAVGSPSQPIVMTSASDLADADNASGDLSAMEAASDGLVGGSSTARGEWGGLVINGLASINDCAAGDRGTAACTKAGEGGSGLFGGIMDDDNSGTLSYVRVQYAGFAFSGTDELNGIAFQGVGDGTQVDHIHVHNNFDDGVEFFGGTVDVSHVVITGAGDDSFDWTDGWRGSAQYVVLVQGPGLSGDPRVIEGDNREGGADNEPRSNPTISNLTIVDTTAGQDAVKVRRGTAGKYMNAVITGDGVADGIDFDSGGTGPAPMFFSTYVANFETPVNDEGVADVFSAAGRNNVISTATLGGSVYSTSETRAVDATDADTTGAAGAADIEDTTYIGAFADGVQSYATSWLNGWSLEVPEFTGTGEQPVASCPAGTTQSARAVPVGRSEQLVCTLPNEILTDTFLPAGNLYEISGTTFVGHDLGNDKMDPDGVSARLTIAAGVTLFGVAGEDALVVTRGSQIVVNGSRTAPVIMTSRQDVDPSLGVTPDRGQWGGLVINGYAPINDCAAGDRGTIECTKTGEGGSGLFGGIEADDDSGSLNYLRVQYAGFAFSGTDELNGIAFQGVGNGTEVDYVQVHRNFDDGIEFFGGNVEVKHVVITGAGDDSFDWTDGWQGKAQFVALRQGPGLSGDPRVIEADNREGGADNEPRSNPTIANLTILDTTAGQDGIKIRRGTNASFYNSIVAGDDIADGIDFDQAGTGPNPTFYSTYVVDFATPLDSEAVAQGIFLASNGNVDGDAVSQDSTLTAASNSNTTLVPGMNELALTPTALPADPFFETADYIGAVEDAADDWYLGWTIDLSN